MSRIARVTLVLAFAFWLYWFRVRRHNLYHGNDPGRIRRGHPAPAGGQLCVQRGQVSLYREKRDRKGYNVGDPGKNMMP